MWMYERRWDREWTRFKRDECGGGRSLVVNGDVVDFPFGVHEVRWVGHSLLAGRRTARSAVLGASVGATQSGVENQGMVKEVLRNVATGGGPMC